MKILRSQLLFKLSKRFSSNIEKPPLFSSVMTEDKRENRQKSRPKFQKPQTPVTPSPVMEIANKLREAVESNGIADLTKELRKACISSTESFVLLLEAILRFNTYYNQFPTKFYDEIIMANQTKLNFEDSCLLFYFLHKFNMLKQHEEFKKHLNSIRPEVVTGLHSKYVQFYCLVARLELYPEIIENFEMSNLDIDKEIIERLSYKVQEANAEKFINKIIAFGNKKLAYTDGKYCLNYVEIYLNVLCGIIERFPELSEVIEIASQNHTNKVADKLSSMLALASNFELSKILVLVNKYDHIMKLPPSTLIKLKGISVDDLLSHSQDKIGDFWMLLNYAAFTVNQEGLSKRFMETEKLVCNLINTNSELYLNNEAFRNLIKYLGAKLDLLDSSNGQNIANFDLEIALIPMISSALNKSVGRRSSSLNFTIKMFYTFRSISSRLKDDAAKTEYTKNIKRLEFLIAFHAKAWIYSENKQKIFFQDYREFCKKRKIGSKKCLALVQMALDNVPFGLRVKQYEKFEELKDAKITLEKKKAGTYRKKTK